VLARASLIDDDGAYEALFAAPESIAVAKMTRKKKVVAKPAPQPVVEWRADGSRRAKSTSTTGNCAHSPRRRRARHRYGTMLTISVLPGRLVVVVSAWGLCVYDGRGARWSSVGYLLWPAQVRQA